MECCGIHLKYFTASAQTTIMFNKFENGTFRIIGANKLILCMLFFRHKLSCGVSQTRTDELWYCEQFRPLDILQYNTTRPIQGKLIITLFRRHIYSKVSQVTDNSTVLITFSCWQQIYHLALCKWNPPVTGGFHTQRDSNAENISMSRRHRDWIPSHLSACPTCVVHNFDKYGL